MRLRVKARLARLRGRSSVTATPRLRVPTYAIFERVCILCGLDPDRVRTGRQAFTEARDPEDPAEVLDLVLTNARSFEVDRLDPHLRVELVGVVLTHFFVEALNTLQQQSESFSATLNRQLSTGSNRSSLHRALASRLPGCRSTNTTA